MTDDETRRECESCGSLYFPNSQRESCPHDYNTTFTRGAMRALRELLSREDEGK